MATKAIDLGYAFGLPPRRAVEYFKSMGYTVSWNWWDTWQQAHLKAFTVAKAIRQDILVDIRQAVEKGLRQGMTMEQFAADLEPTLRRKGWWGTHTVIGPEGQLVKVRLGSWHRMRTIYRTNISTAQAVAHYQNQVENAAARPYLQYESMDDDNTRPNHAALNGKVFRYNDKFWGTHYPPNGFGCRCRVRALTDEQLQREGLEAESSEGRLHEIEQEVGVDRMTGEVVTAPATEYRSSGVKMAPDPGWNYNPGKTGTFTDPSALPPLSRPSLPMRNQKSWHDWNRPPELPVHPEANRGFLGGLTTAAAIDNAVEQGRIQERAVTLATGRKMPALYRVTTPDGVDDVVIPQQQLHHAMNTATNERNQHMFLNILLNTLATPAEVWRRWTESAEGRLQLNSVFLSAFRVADEDRFFAAQVEWKTGNISWEEMRGLSGGAKVNELRAGTLLYAADGGGTNER